MSSLRVPALSLLTAVFSAFSAATQKKVHVAAEKAGMPGDEDSSLLYFGLHCVRLLVF